MNLAPIALLHTAGTLALFAWLGPSIRAGFWTFGELLLLSLLWPIVVPIAWTQAKIEDRRFHKRERAERERLRRMFPPGYL